MEIFKTSKIDTFSAKQELLRLGQRSLLENTDKNLTPYQELLLNPITVTVGALALLFPFTRKIIFRVTPFVIHRFLR